MRRKKLFKALLFALIVFLGSGIFCFYHIEIFSQPFLVEQLQIAQLPDCKTAIVLGTSRNLKSGIENLFFRYRIDAAEKLYRSGKIKYLILSGDNRAHDYNEPADMKKALIALGVPDSCLIPDYAGLRTFDSMVRCKEIFGQDSVIVISQQFHNARAVFIGRKNGLAAFGLNAQKVTSQKAFKTHVREFFSRIKCMLDLYILNTHPKHLGEKIRIR